MRRLQNIFQTRAWSNPAKTILVAGGLLTLLISVKRLSVSVLVEGVLLTTIMVVAISLPPLREGVRGWPRWGRIAGTTLLILLLGGQLNGRVQDIFPFTRWDMFTTGEPREVVSYFEFVGQRADGSEVKFLPESGGMFSFRRWIGFAAQERNNPQLTESQRERARSRFQEYGPLVLEGYNREHPRAPIRSYRVYENRKFLREHPRVERILLGAWPLDQEAR